jgi:DNA mismatch repair protein MutS2
MNTRIYRVLELDKILARLATYASFSASQALITALEPTSNIEEALRRQQETTEARTLLVEKPTLTIGGVRDVRALAGNASRGIVPAPEQFIDIKGTLVSAAALKRAITAVGERYPLLAKVAEGIDECRDVVAAIERVISDQGSVLNSASPKLADLRNKLAAAHDRLRAKLQNIINSGQYAPYLQEALITLRDGRYVIPVRAEYRGRVKGIVHDQSSSGQTVFIEPMATVEINNDIRQMELAEEEEVRRILAELTSLVGEYAEPIVWTVEAVADIDAALARARYAEALRAVAPTLSGFDPHRKPRSTIRLFNARHPLLDQRTAVPIDVDLDDQTFVLIITGPNTGGKTVSLKTVGLLVLMAQCGLHLPATDAHLTVFESIHADIGDEQSIEQSLSTFSAHLMHIIQVLEQADSHSLVIMDELGSGTDPAEGAAIARAILDDFVQRGVTTFVATHYPELKLYAHGTPGVRNASVEFNVETLSPTYRLMIGLPGRSNAIAIATRLGLPQRIIEAARSMVGESDLQADAMLDEIHTTRDEVRQAQARVTAAEQESAALRDELSNRLTEIEAERTAIIEAARAESEHELTTLRDEIAEQRRKLRAISPVQAAEAIAEIKEIQEEADEIAEILEAPVEKAVEPLPAAPTRRSFRVGDSVYVDGLNAEGEINEIYDSGEAEVFIGNLRARVDLDSLELRRPKRAERTSDFGSIRLPSAESPGLELHLRGLTVDEALPAVDEYINQAAVAGLPWVRIIHGKGSGALRKAIRDSLRGHPLVKQYASAGDSEGGDGATVVTLNSVN